VVSQAFIKVCKLEPIVMVVIVPPEATVEQSQVSPAPKAIEGLACVVAGVEALTYV
jgi:hypothetical protein